MREDLQDDPHSLTGVIPFFDQAPNRPGRVEAEPLTVDPEQPPSASPETDTSPLGREVPRPDRSGTRTPTSTTGEAKPTTAKEVGQLVTVLLTALAVGASMFVRWRTANARKLRQPTDEQAAAIGEPLGRIAHRHIPLPKLVPDLADAVEAAVGLNRYLDAGPLTVYEGLDPGLPTNLNQETL